jgi:hypothetical protein
LLRRQVLAGTYRLLDATQLADQGAPVVHLETRWRVRGRSR